jgi:hypothetical protein
VVTVAGGDILAVVRDNFEVNQSRVFTLARGDILMWASDGNVDAGRGAKTVSGAPAPVLRLDANGNLVLDTSGSFSGSGIATLDENSAVGLFAPRQVPPLELRLKPQSSDLAKLRKEQGMHGCNWPVVLLQLPTNPDGGMVIGKGRSSLASS